MRVEIGWKIEGYTEIELSEHEVEIAVELGATLDDAYSIVDALIANDHDWLGHVIEDDVANAHPGEFLSAVELTEED